MSIRHKPKNTININQLVIDLENPLLENLESLNQQLGKYLDKVEEPLVLSFWESVTFTYWSYVNLLKLTDKKYDIDSEEFVKRIYEIANKNMRYSPRPQTISASDNSEQVTETPRSWMSYMQPKYIVGGVIALLVVGVTVKLVKDE